MWLFGSWARGEGEAGSDVDIFVEFGGELTTIPAELLVCNGGPVDAFWMPGNDGWARAVGEERRMLLCWDRFGLCIGPIVPIAPEDRAALATQVST